jgi:hypothetical protein
MDRSSFPNKQQDKSSYNIEKKEDLKPEAAANRTQQSSSVNTSKNTVDSSYINSCMEDICINKNSLLSFKRMIEKLYSKDDVDFYVRCEGFIEEVNNSVKRGKFTNTSIKNLEYLGGEIYLTKETIETIVKHHNNQFAEEELRRQQKEEKERKQKEEERKRKQAEEERRRQEEEAERRKQAEEAAEQKKQAEEAEQKKQAEEAEQKRQAEERQKNISRNYIIGIALTISTSLIAISMSGWAIVISFATLIGAYVLLGFWYNFHDKANSKKIYLPIIVGIIFSILTSLITISMNGWAIVMSFVATIGAYVLLCFWHKFYDDANSKKTYLPILVGIIFYILFAYIFFSNHSWWSLFSILLAIVVGFISTFIYELID